METKFDPNAKVKAGALNTAPDGKQPNQEAKNIDYPTKSGKEHVQDSLFKLADQKDY